MNFFWTFIVVFLGYSIICFLFPKILIEGESMLPNIQNESIVFGKNNYVFYSKVKRGDIISFNIDGEEDRYIKRVVGLPGNTIQITDGKLILNKKVIEKKISPEMNEFTETFTNGVSYKVLDTGDSGVYDNTVEYLVPEGHYFVLGDNRDDSNDSRDLSFIPYKNIEEIILPETNFIYKVSFLFF